MTANSNICKIGSDPYKELALKLLSLPYVTSIKRAEDYILVKTGRTPFAIRVDEEGVVYVNPQDAHFYDDPIMYMSRFVNVSDKVVYVDSEPVSTLDSLKTSLLKTFGMKDPCVVEEDTKTIIKFSVSGCDVEIQLIDDEKFLRAVVYVALSDKAMIKEPQIQTVVRRYINVHMMELIPTEVFGTETYIFYRK